MTPWKMLKAIEEFCMYSVSININDHKNSAETILEYLCEWGFPEKEIMDEMLKRNSLVEIQAYQTSAGGFQYVAHYDLAKAIKSMYDIFKEEIEKQNKLKEGFNAKN